MTQAQPSFWQIIARDHDHPVWKLGWVGVILIAIYVSVNSFDLRGTEGRQLVYMALGGGLFKGAQLGFSEAMRRNDGGG